MTNKYQSNPHLQGTNEGNKNKAKESKIICCVAFNQTLDKGFDYPGKEHTGTLFLGGRRLLGSHASPAPAPSHHLPWRRRGKLRHLEAKLGRSPHQSRGWPAPPRSQGWRFRCKLDLSSSWKIPGSQISPVPGPNCWSLGQREKPEIPAFSWKTLDVSSEAPNASAPPQGLWGWVGGAARPDQGAATSHCTARGSALRRGG